MALLSVEFSPSALSDLQVILDYYEEQGVADIGKQIVQKLIDATQTLPNFPEMGRTVPEFDTPTLRELIQPPYRAVYHLTPDRIAIIRVWRSERLLTPHNITTTN